MDGASQQPVHLSKGKGLAILIAIALAIAIAWFAASQFISFAEPGEARCEEAGGRYVPSPEGGIVGPRCCGSDVAPDECIDSGDV